MKFAQIQMLFLFWAVPLLLLVYWYGWRRRKNILDRFADARTLTVLIPQGMDSRRRWRAALVLTAALLLVAALAGPQYGYQWQKVERRGVDLIIALDCSRSMLAKDIQPTRLDRAKREIIDLLAMLQGDRVGLVAFSGTAFLQCPLTLDYSAFDLFLNVLTPDYLPIGGTDLSAAVQTALNGFDPQSAADKAVILITDGENTGHGDPEQAAKAAQKAGVKLFCIGVGSGEGVPVPSEQGGFKKDPQGQIVLSRLDEPLLTRMAVSTGGTYVRSVAGDMDLDAIYRDRIRGNMQSATVESNRKKVWADRYQWPLALSIILLFIAQALPAVKKSILALLLALWVLTPQGPAMAGPMRDGNQAYRDGDYDQALKHFIDGQLKDPDNTEVLYNIGNAYYKTGNYDAAKENYSQALSQAPPDLKAKLLYNLGNTAYRKGELQEAIKDYQAALKMAPQDVQAKENLAFVQKQLQQRTQGASKNESPQQNPQEQNKAQTGQQQDQNPQGSNQPQEQQRQSPPGTNKKETPPAPRYGSEMDKDAQKQNANAGQDKKEPPPAQEQSGATAQNPAGGQQQVPSAAAEQMLNRLKDEPGRAMMPRYKKMPVEKDW